MKDYGSEIELLRCYYYAIDLPVRLLENGQVTFSMPEEIRTAADITGNDAFSALAAEDDDVQYLETAASESFIYLRLDETAVISVGPFLLNKPSESFIVNMARSGMIHLRNKSTIMKYYDSLPLISKQRFFYAGQLLKTIIASGSVGEARISPGENSLSFIKGEYYRNAKDYRSQQFRHSPYIVEQEICRMISNGDMQGAHRVLKEINSRPRAVLAGSAIRSLKNSVICSCSFMTRAAISGGVSPDEAFTLSDTYIQLVENCTDMKAVLNYENEMVDGFTRAVGEAKNNRYSQAVTGALNFIDAHLCEPISVQDVADSVYLSPNYLSSLFMRETGETIHGCIIRRRIDEAGFFLRNSSDPVADIASFYQFSSQSHFVQSFKRIKGVTPGAYRRDGIVQEDAL